MNDARLRGTFNGAIGRWRSLYNLYGNNLMIEFLFDCFAGQLWLRRQSALLSTKIFRVNEVVGNGRYFSPR